VPNQLSIRSPAAAPMGRAARDIRRVNNQAAVALHTQELAAFLYYQHSRLAEDATILRVQSIKRVVDFAKAATEDTPEALPAVAVALEDCLMATGMAFRQAFANPF